MSHARNPITASEALARLKDGNKRFIDASYNPGDVSFALREKLQSGQHPYAVVVCCSDSRVIPEAIFSAGLGEIFSVRVAGNVLGEHEMGSVEYAVDHLGSNLVLILGHEKCGAVAATLEGGAKGYVETLTRSINEAIGDKKDPKEAACANAAYVAEQMKVKLHIPEGVEIISAYYNIDGRVDF